MTINHVKIKHHTKYRHTYVYLYVILLRILNLNLMKHVEINILSYRWIHQIMTEFEFNLTFRAIISNGIKVHSHITW